MPLDPNEKIRVLAVAGARPNFMKIAPLMHEFARRPDRFEPVLVHTGQHYDKAMSESFFEDLGIPQPDVNLGVGSGSHGQQTAQVLMKIEELLIERRPHAVLVVGDVNSTIAAALAAVKLDIPVAHVEAGLRSWDRKMPEEINRVLTDSVSHWLFTTEPSAEENLLREGVAPEKIHFVGNVMIDTLLAHQERARELDTLARLGLSPHSYAVLTLHRPSNVDSAERLIRLFEVLGRLNKELPVIFPIHPRTAHAIEANLGGLKPDLHLTDPLGYLDFLRLLTDAQMVLTDSGGIQEETTALGVPCLTLRNSTERPVTVTEGTNRIVGTDPAAIETAIADLRNGPAGEKNGRRPALWDGRAAARIVDILERDFSERELDKV
ncbi:MAG: UDP-N-acetylglucosamine 2-epimerase (non-hydrolyzing) [bacterium]|nr:UDP-N-acetylglucosamine 2-epimerase (non-hydrolyzing) [Deltaproteobacteria bacterium]MCP4905555.1 UDP-N-acetylglucosamine 2-epimerase (non-hydrolyzing) [bacterium]